MKGIATDDVPSSGGDRGKRPIVTQISPVLLPPAKRLKQACLSFKVISAVEPNATLKPKFQPLNQAKELVLSLSNQSFGGNDLASATNDENESDDLVVLLEPGKGQRSISEFISPATTNDNSKVPSLPPNEVESLPSSTKSSQDSVATLSSSAGGKPFEDDSPVVNNGQGSAKASTDAESSPMSKSMQPKVDTSLSVNGCKITKKRKKVSKDPIAQLEKDRLKEERRLAQEKREQLKLELMRLKTEKMEQRLKMKEMKMKLEEQAKQKKLNALEVKQKQLERLKGLEEAKKEKEIVEEEANRKSEKARATFASFFIKKPLTPPAFEKPKNLGTFLPFQVKENMKLAPIHRNNLCNTSGLRQKLDSVMLAQNDTPRYLEEIKSIDGLPRSCSRTWAPAAFSDTKDVEVIDVNSEKSVQRVKLLQFVENVRPPYWGTWRKKSSIINPRNPLKRDERFFDYNFDSDEEWDDEVELGESLSHTEDEKEVEDDYEVDNELFVPHGYLSDEEAHDEEENRVVSPQTLKAQLKIKEQEFLKERTKKCLKINPRVLGCIWMDEHQNELNNVLEDYDAVVITSFPIETRSSMQTSVESGGCDGTGDMVKSLSVAKYTKELPYDAMQHLIRLVHGNQYSSKLISNEFQEFWKQHTEQQCDRDSTGETVVASNQSSRFSKVLLLSTIKKIATWGKFPEKGPLGTSKAWYVMREERLKYGMDVLPIPNKWKYCSSPETRNKLATPKVKISPNGPGTIEFFTKCHSSPKPSTSANCDIITIDSAEDC